MLLYSYNSSTELNTSPNNQGLIDIKWKVHTRSKLISTNAEQLIIPSDSFQRPWVSKYIDHVYRFIRQSIMIIILELLSVIKHSCMVSNISRHEPILIWERKQAFWYYKNMNETRAHRRWNLTSFTINDISGRKMIPSYDDKRRRR